MLRLVNIATVIPEALVDLRYAGPRNVTGRPIYASNIARLRQPAAEALKQAADQLAGQGFKLVIWDAYRPLKAQKKLRKVCADDRYVAKHSKHCRGNALDLTLANLTGRLLDMGTDHDDFSSQAHLDTKQITAEQRANRQLLQHAMLAAGFSPWPYEWWHFEYLKKSRKPRLFSVREEHQYAKV